MNDNGFRLCVFGNSHVAALRGAWAGHPGRWPGLRAQFIGAHGALLLDADIRDGRLTPVTEDAKAAFRRLGGVDMVDLAAFDGFVIAGCMVAMAQAAMIYRDMRWPGLPSLDREDDLAGLPQAFVSGGAARATLESVLARRLGPGFARHLRAGTDRPIWITSQPRMSAAGLAPRATQLRSYIAAHRAGDGPALSALFEDAATRAAISAGAQFLSQPDHTITDAILTAECYMQGAARLTPKGNILQAPDDLSHGNAAYGAAVFDQIAAVVR